MDRTLPKSTLNELASHDVGEIRVFLTDAADCLRDIVLVKDCLHDHLLAIAKNDPDCYAPLKPFFDSGAFDQVRSLVDSIRTAVIECDEYLLKSLRDAEDEPQVSTD